MGEEEVYFAIKYAYLSNLLSPTSIKRKDTDDPRTLTRSGLLFCYFSLTRIQGGFFDSRRAIAQQRTTDRICYRILLLILSAAISKCIGCRLTETSKIHSFATIVVFDTLHFLDIILKLN